MITDYVERKTVFKRALELPAIIVRNRITNHVAGFQPHPADVQNSDVPWRDSNAVSGEAKPAR